VNGGGRAPAPISPNVESSRVRVQWEGDFEALHSLAMVNRVICHGLIDRGLDLTIIARPPGPSDERAELDARLRERSQGAGALSGCDTQVHVRHRWPPQLEPPSHGKWVLMQPWEFGSLPRAWIPMLRRVDEVWAYSRYVRDCYLEAVSR
jgi:hypothetical protein